MNCTKCSAPVRPVVAFDIDGTMGYYHEHFLIFACAYLGLTHPGIYSRDMYNGAQAFRVWFTEFFNVDTRTFRDIKLAYRQGAQKRSMPVRHWAREAVVLARKLNAEVWVTTTRPYMRLDNVDPDTRFWLNRHGIKYDYLIYGDYKYEELSNQVDPARVCFVLDDLPEQVSNAKKFFGWDTCWLYATPWNAAHHEAYHPYILEDDYPVICGTIERAIEKWKTEH